MLSIRFYIGRTDRDGRTVGDKETGDALELLARSYPNGLTRFHGYGVWMGNSEAMFLVEAIVDYPVAKDRAREVAAEIATIMSQSCAGVAFSEVAFELVNP